MNELKEICDLLDNQYGNYGYRVVKAENDGCCWNLIVAKKIEKKESQKKTKEE